MKDTLETATLTGLLIVGLAILGCGSPSTTTGSGGHDGNAGSGGNTGGASGNAGSGGNAAGASGNAGSGGNAAGASGSAGSGGDTGGRGGQAGGGAGNGGHIGGAGSGGSGGGAGGRGGQAGGGAGRTGQGGAAGGFQCTGVLELGSCSNEQEGLVCTIIGEAPLPCNCLPGQGGPTWQCGAALPCPNTTPATGQPCPSSSVSTVAAFGGCKYLPQRVCSCQATDGGASAAWSCAAG